MRHRLLYVFIALISPVLAQAQSPDIHHRARILLEGRGVQALGALGIETDHGQHAPFKHLVSDFSEEELRLVAQAGFAYDILIPNVDAYYRDPAIRAAHDGQAKGGGYPCEEVVDATADRYPVPANFRLGGMAGFYTYQDMLDILDTMRMRYPHLITTKRIVSPSIVTHNGNPIYWLRISDNPDLDEAAEPEVFYNALHHAREPNSLTQLIYYMWYLLENYETDPEVRFIVDNTALYFIPCINPDGYIYNEQIAPEGGGQWRKNRRQNPNGTFGVDLNRNYGYEWGHDDFGSSPNQGSQVYRGPGPFSEPETQAIRAFCNDHEFVVALNYHTYGDLLVYPWGYSDTPTQDAPTFNTLARVMTIENNFLAGTGSETVGYVTNGDSDDWMYGETGTKPVILSMTPEIGDPSSGFWPSIPEIIPNCKATMWMNLAAGLAPHHAGLLTPDAGQSTLAAEQPYLKYNLRRFGLADGTLTVSLTALDDLWVEVLDAPVAFSLARNEIISDSIALRYADGIPHGTELRFLLHLNNGSYTHTDTIVRTFYNFETTVSFQDDYTDLTAWTSAEDWNLTEEDYVTEPTSLTDSPYADYADNSNTAITLDAPIAVGQADEYRLWFWAKWNIEADYDYAQLQISVNEGDWMPACGRYTKAGSDWQALNEPIWDGIQMEWVQEEIDLDGLVADGDNIRLRFVLGSDGALTMDGFYVDDLVYEERNVGTVSAVRVLDAADFTVRVYPNPTSGAAYFKLDAPQLRQGTGTWVLYHSSGLPVGRGTFRAPQAAVPVDVAALPAGSYWLRIAANGQALPAQKLMIIK